MSAAGRKEALDLDGAAFLHAHPDDETLATGTLLAGLVRSGARVAVVTATRGERGEIRPGVLDGATATELVAHREGELAAALAELGVTEHAFLGSAPALATGRTPRRYTDSGMVWVTETVAGSAPDAGADSLTAADPDAAASDLVAYLDWFGATCVVSYDAHGGYGHPDHVACHRIAKLAAAAAGLPFVEVVSEVSLPAPDAVEIAHPELLGVVRAALGCYASQLRVAGDEVVHVGGQHQAILTSHWLR